MIAILKYALPFTTFMLKFLNLRNSCLGILILRFFLIVCFVPPTQDSDSPPKISSILSFLSHALQIRTQVSKLCPSAFPQVTLRFIFQSGRQSSGFFLFKDQTPMLMRLRVVYKYMCQCCGALYLGQTRCYLHTRISEHMGVLPLMGKK